jgi:inorganic pyrophosphatase/exopolyphosphatase
LAGGSRASSRRVKKLRAVVSRKKQLLPYLTHCLHETEKGVKD